jgi:hypothetical protein
MSLGHLELRDFGVQAEITFAKTRNQLRKNKSASISYYIWSLYNQAVIKLIYSVLKAEAYKPN